MAALAHKPISNIAAAFAAQSGLHHGLDAPETGSLLTPPSSISPTLRPAYKRRGVSTPGRVHTPDTMEIDLQDAVEHAAAQDQPSALALSKEALAGLDATRQITALLLAKHYLPDIIVGHGAMPIREMMAHLTHSVPGFSGLPPAKARRLVVAALEHRAGGGVHGQVKFEKVGWGRWSVAPSSQNRGVPIGGSRAGRRNTPPASMDSPACRGLQIPRLRHEASRDVYSGSWAAGSWSPPHNQHSEDDEMADQMSLDDSDSASDMDLEADLDLNDDTDQEDWSTMGPQPRSGPRREYRDYNYLSRTQTSDFRQRSVSAQAQSVPTPHARLDTPVFKSTLAAPPAVAGPGSGAEREAIEALIAMGSM
ncbi:hypothetical protein P153DRAFT_369698 [Dothidotthia symphoricarpi CBS 119687]|uniref:Sin3 binding protein-domain-containing protein n=1 Tax=Dothidotthia symphoricarpi CBS 119687 TaxID=1392245 RepID=A0A6A6A4K2_9PLEO|nr:uncharacterized protein P153DRAFT_369698 [Dothidotthia symphoricarpi CBS 119687]KAF2125688.1 hypothetical protein P153DRAFT_369698 [Dothidotthia symphoricarpi CBS 119687]